MNIAILDDYQHAVPQLNCFELLKDFNVKILDKTYQNPKDLAKEIQDTEILVLIRERTKIDDELLSLLPNLKLISQTGKISNHLDLAACTKYGVAVAEGIGSPIAPAELTWALIMNATRKIPQAIEAMKKGEWQTNIGSAIHGKTIGIWGYGKIGQKIAQYAKVFGAEVLVWGSENSRQKAKEDGYQAANSREEFFSISDVISLHIRLNEQTKGSVKFEDLKLMKREAVIVNTSRAELIEENALSKALSQNTPTYAALDVYEIEPIYDQTNEFLKNPNVICTPHLGYVEENSYELYFSKAFENAINFIAANPTNIANSEVLK
ncbi:D-isomer specific 2-hydroxyacid dehydrogenase [Empedobacter brevis NBRC 14943 = ATCC 43319]|uniref:D-isomer specific 2-hydroxyacid dehydrogenase n=1 Tax=Empedobacter brevis NBRC 14943 = ATCC 43319 TaxID=1218108 RepID=A0A511NCY5_9FLAO|nr:D-2-hydroxyacid dehydrogenase family protein [Empedobacter brevis]GEM50675.1 D-isomer specific 2-hydroxyacid dehydrogenase [Empedobacter brevis NBRC 14943 = ATCC 43319]